MPIFPPKIASSDMRILQKNGSTPTMYHASADDDRKMIQSIAGKPRIELDVSGHKFSFDSSALRENTSILRDLATATSPNALKLAEYEIALQMSMFEDESPGCSEHALETLYLYISFGTMSTRLTRGSVDGWFDIIFQVALFNFAVYNFKDITFARIVLAEIDYALNPMKLADGSENRRALRDEEIKALLNIAGSDDLVDAVIGRMKGFAEGAHGNQDLNPPWRYAAFHRSYEMNNEIWDKMAAIAEAAAKKKKAAKAKKAGLVPDEDDWRSYKEYEIPVRGRIMSG